MDYAKIILLNRRALLYCLDRHIEERLRPYWEALNWFFGELFSGRLPVDWRERWHAVVGEQASRGFFTDPKSVRDVEAYVEAWARFCGLFPIEEQRPAAVLAQSTTAANAKPPASAHRPGRRIVSQRESFFDEKLAAAQRSLYEIDSVLKTLGGKIDFARLDESIEVDAEAQRVEELIWGYNDAIESARDAWLRDDLSSAAHERLLSMRAPQDLGLPSFTDNAQAQRAGEQQRRIDQRLAGRHQNAKRVGAESKPANGSECVVCLTVGGHVLVVAFPRDGKWRVAKQLAHPTGTLTPEERAALYPHAPSNHHGAKLAAAIAAFILARRAIGAASAAVNAPTAPLASVAGGSHAGGNIGRGDQTQFARSAEEVVSEATGVPLNPRGPQEQRIPGTGPGGYRVPDLKPSGPEGSILNRGTIIEIKASSDKKFKSLSARSRRQILDAVKRVNRLREKARFVKDPAKSALLERAHVEVFTDLDPPQTGKFFDLIEKRLIRWKRIPRQPPRASGAIAKPGLGMAQNVALGILISIVEAGVADEIHRNSAKTLDELLRQMVENGDADEKQWNDIEGRLKEIAAMKQSVLGYIWEVISYGQGSLAERQAMAMNLLAWELADTHGYQNKKTWGEILAGGLGKFEKKQ